MDTIFAPATPPGRSGVAVLRISGDRAACVFERFSCATPSPRLAKLVTLRHPQSGELVDQALALYFTAPASFTGEDVVELHLHGSRAIMQEVVMLLGEMEGFRLAEPGEFTRRAFFHHKLDLTQAEGIADLIDADTAAQKRQALRQLDGNLGRISDQLRTGIIEVRAHLEAYLDFPDEEIPENVALSLNEEISSLSQEIATLLKDNRCGEIVRDGCYVVILGTPNAGKSTLMNALARRDIAIVSTVAGTTRDVLEAQLDIGGYSLTLADTAGLHDTSEEIEAEGIRRAMHKAAQADFCILLFDASRPRHIQHAVEAQLQQGDVVILNKSDEHPLYIDEFATLNPHAMISAKTGKHMDCLLSVLKERMESRLSGSQDAVITRARHRLAFETALQHLEAAQQEVALELKGESLRLASMELGKITGAIHIEDVLDVVFSSFCIGK